MTEPVAPVDADHDSDATPPRSDALVVFGYSGDLARRKTFPALYAMARRGDLDLPVVGIAASDLDDGANRQRIR